VATPPDAVADPTARHPLDPEPVRSSKTTTVLWLGVFAVLTGPLVGGVVPALVALQLARQARAELAAARGYLTGAGRLQVGLTLAWVGLVLAAIALVTAGVIGILNLVDPAGQDFPPTSN